MRRRVVVSGLGAINALGTNVTEFHNVLADLAETPGLDSHEVASSPAHFISLAEYLRSDPHATELDWSPELWALAETCPVSRVCSEQLRKLSRRAFGRWYKWVRRLERSVLFSAIAGAEALQCAGLLREQDGFLTLATDLCDPYRAGALITDSGLHFRVHERNQNILQEGYITHLEPFYLLNGISNTSAGLVSQIYQLRGPALNLAAGEATSLACLHTGRLLIEQDQADICLVGSGESALSVSLRAVQVAAQALAPAIAMTPPDTALAEGGVVLCLEEYRHALRRGARIYAEVLGSALTQRMTLDPGTQDLLPGKADAARAQNYRQCLDMLPHDNFAGSREYYGAADFAPQGPHEWQRGKLSPLLGDCLGAAGLMEIVAALQPRTQLGPRRILCHSLGLGGHCASALLETPAAK